MPFVTVTAKVFSDATGAHTEVPAILTPQGILLPLLDYCMHRRHDRSLSWQRKLVQSVQIFLIYMEANTEEEEPWRLFRNFAQRLYTGTFDIQSGLDPSNLCWQPRSWAVARYTITLLSDFFDYLTEVGYATNNLNPKYRSTTFDKRIDEAAYLYRRSKAFLGHTWAFNPEAMSLGRFVRSKRLPFTATHEPPEFPAERFEELLFRGFKVGGQYDYRGMLITLLLHGAGFRASEPFHLYITDVNPNPADPTSALVLIHHPSQGFVSEYNFESTQKNTKTTRSTFLASKWSLPPRTELIGRAHAGWKSPKLDGEYFMRAWWFDPVYGKWFLQIWQRYMKQVAMVDRNHPFAFINLGRAPVGDMYCLDSYMKAHEGAVRRIGLPYGKLHGTTPHGHRHSYAQRLKRAGVEKLLRQTFLHHCSIESQDIYTQPTNAEIEAIIQTASENLRLKYGEPNMPELQSI